MEKLKNITDYQLEEINEEEILNIEGGRSAWGWAGFIVGGVMVFTGGLAPLGVGLIAAAVAAD